MKRLWALLLVLVLCVSARAFLTSQTAPNTSEQAEEYTPLLYEVTDADGDRIWLFGSIHVGDESMYPLPAYVTEAYEEADALAVECDVLNVSAETSSNMITMLTESKYPDGTTIRDHIDKEVYESAKALLEEHNMYSSVYESYQPVLWWMMLQEIASSAYDTNYGIDMYFLREATADGKPILEIESAEAQYEVLFSFSPELQVLLLEQTVEGLESPLGTLSVDMLIRAWKSGNERLIETMSRSEDTTLSEEEQLLYDEYAQNMMGDRDLLMANFAEQALIDGKDVFICVGSAHVIGDEAMVGILRDRGYTVEKVS